MQTQDNRDPQRQNQEMHSTLKSLLKVCSDLIISWVILFLWIWGLNWLFKHCIHENYVVWFIKSGTLISAATAIFAVVWEGLEAQEGLLSWQPEMFLASCFRLASMFFKALGAIYTEGRRDGENRRSIIYMIETSWDVVWSGFMILLMIVAVLGWILVVAPLFYLLTLFTGGPARQEIRGTGHRLLVKKEEFLTTILDQPASAPIPDKATEISFAKRPLALTNALNAAVLYLASLLLHVAG